WKMSWIVNRSLCNLNCLRIPAMSFLFKTYVTSGCYNMFASCILSFFHGKSLVSYLRIVMPGRLKKGLPPGGAPWNRLFIDDVSCQQWYVLLSTGLGNDRHHFLQFMSRIELFESLIDTTPAAKNRIIRTGFAIRFRRLNRLLAMCTFHHIPSSLH